MLTHPGNSGNGAKLNISAEMLASRNPGLIRRTWNRIVGRAKKVDRANLKLAIGVAAIFACPYILFLWDAAVPASSWFHEFIHIAAPELPKDFWEIITGTSTLALAVVAYRGLKSLGLAKHDIRSRLARDASQSAVAQSSAFAREILSQGRSIKDKLGDSGITVFVNNVSEVRFDSVTAQELERAGKWVDALPPELRTDCIELMNDLEAWSMHFTCGLADADVVYGPCATPFFSLVMRFYPLLIVFRDHGLSGKFPHTVMLFEAWKAQREQDENEEQLTEVLERMHDIDVNPQKTRLRRPIGEEGLD